MCSLSFSIVFAAFGTFNLSFSRAVSMAMICNMWDAQLFTFDRTSFVILFLGIFDCRYLGECVSLVRNPWAQSVEERLSQGAWGRRHPHEHKNSSKEQRGTQTKKPNGPQPRDQCWLGGHT